MRHDWPYRLARHHQKAARRSKRAQAKASVDISIESPRPPVGWKGHDTHGTQCYSSIIAPVSRDHPTADLRAERHGSDLEKRQMRKLTAILGAEP
jgi:hypothetical protein